MRKVAIIGIILHSLISCFIFAQENDISSRYVWKNVAIGGGGYVTGIVVHPKFKDLVYVRTDIGGSYRWDEAGKSWIPLNDMFGFDESNLYGIDGIAVDPQKKNTVYLAAGKYEKNTPHDVMKSVDSGASWKRTYLFDDKDSIKNKNKFGGNQLDRSLGEPIAVHPTNSSLIMVVTRKNGLWISRDEAKTWQQAMDIPVGHQMRSVVFAKKKACGKYPMYAAVEGKGLYASMNDGKNWKLVKNSPADLQRIESVEDGSLLVATENALFHWKNNTWINISPVKGLRYNAMAVNPFDTRMIIVSQNEGKLGIPFWLTKDGGKTWIQLNDRSILKPSVPWAPRKHFASATSAFEFDPHYPGRVWFTDWYATWRTHDITADSVVWESNENGHEEIVTFLMITPEKGVSLISGIADVRGFRHTNLDKIPQEYIHKNDTNKDVTGLDFCEADPNFIVRTSTHGTENDRGTGAVSEDNGLTWRYFENWTYGALGRVAMSATDHRVILAAPWSGKVKRSEDFGKTWTDVQGAPAAIVSDVWQWHQPLVSDRVNGDLFYIFFKGKVYRSTDAGKSFEFISELPYEGFYGIKTVPHRAGEVWVNADKQGLFKSVDSGKTFVKIAHVERAHLFAFGKNPEGKDHPAVYIYGKVNGVNGIFRSDDYGNTWMKINDADHQLGNVPNSMAADRQVFGRVYIGTDGRGLFYGQEK